MELGNLGKLIFTIDTWAVIFLGGVFSTSFCFASLEGEIQTQIFQYSTDRTPTFYLSSQTQLVTQDFVSEYHLYYESGSKGAWSFDPDPIRYQLKLDDAGKNFFWFGREQPLNLTRAYAVEPFTALGSVWTQNQLDALNPRVSGWVGMGLVHELPADLKINLAYSPLFLPTFGPSLGFTDRGDVNPSRFARLPPASAETGGVTVPIRYQLQVGQLSQLLLQHQAFAGITHDESSYSFDVYAYTAPQPDPLAITNAKLAVTENDLVNAKVQIEPQFPRQYWSGARFQWKDVSFAPAVEFLQNLKDTTLRVFSLTNYFTAFQLNPFLVKKPSKATFGFLSHFAQNYSAPQFSDFLVFVRYPIDITDYLTFRTLLEATLLNGKQSLYWKNELNYALSENFFIIAAIQVLNGPDHSYFGDWRAENSYSAGVRYLW